MTSRTKDRLRLQVKLKVAQHDKQDQRWRTMTSWAIDRKRLQAELNVAHSGLYMSDRHGSVSAVRTGCRMRDHVANVATTTRLLDVE